MEANDEILVVILTGAGRSFVAGADIGQMKDFTSVQAKKFGAYGNGVFLKLENFPKPVIAAVNGVALAALFLLGVWLQFFGLRCTCGRHEIFGTDVLRVTEVLTEFLSIRR